MVTNFPAASSLPLQVLVYIDAESRKKEAMYFFFFLQNSGWFQRSFEADAQNLHICDGPESCTG